MDSDVVHVMRSVYVSGLAINNLSHLPPHISAKDRAKKYPDMLHESGGKLFCSLCNKILDYKRKSTIDYHLSGSKHLRQTDLWNQRKYKQLTMSEMASRMMAAGHDRNEVSKSDSCFICPGSMMISV